MVPPITQAKGLTTSISRLVRLGVAISAGTLGGVTAVPPDALAKVVGFEVVKIESPAFGGRSFGSIGSYDRILARATIAVDPLDRHNAAIVDIGLAPRNAQGLVEATSEVEILRPTDPAKGSDKLLFEVLNRGRKPGLALFNDGPGKDDLADPVNIGSGFLMERGYTLVWAGWQPDAPPGEGRLTLAVPTIPNVTGPSVEEFVFDNTISPGPRSRSPRPRRSGSPRATRVRRSRNAIRHRAIMSPPSRARLASSLRNDFFSRRTRSESSSERRRKCEN